ncbi:bile acid:sodium symporter family protein [Novosphingobium rhizovicinum]|uniref:Bile acid:sodium symporter family protein n=1 Tax=Novosphingobium rhizovicinum TaxID=3228928 RepID=A0ABV3RCN2_9SPHN
MRGRSFVPGIDPFLVCLIVVVVAASLLPVRGVAASAFDGLADVAIGLLFFLHGAKLSRAAIGQGIGNWRLHGLTLASTYLWFPAIGLLTVQLVEGWLNPLLVTGVLFLTLVPSTVQSSIAFTAMARGNVAAAVCSASLSNLLGILVTPLLVGFFIHSRASEQGVDWQGAQGIVLQLLVPFLSGHLLRPVIGGFVDRNKKVLMFVDRGSILLVVYTAFSAAVVNGIWQILDLRDLLMLLVLSALVLAAVLLLSGFTGKLAKLPREDRIVLLFCGSKKSMVSGVPMAGALFAPAEVGLVVLPLMIFHQLQLFVCAWLAGRYARASEAQEPASVTRMAERRAMQAREGDVV